MKCNMNRTLYNIKLFICVYCIKCDACAECVWGMINKSKSLLHLAYNLNLESRRE